MTKLRTIINRVLLPGLCPECGTTMSLLIAQYKACNITPRGWIESIADTQSKYTCVCQHCGYTRDMKITVNGLTPIDYNEEDGRPKLLSDTENPIGNDF